MSHNHINSTIVVDDVNCVGSKKHQRKFGKRKLLLNERVEVRSMKKGLLGSWNSGIVIRCGRQKRHVRYDYILEDGGSKYVVEVVTVPAVLDGESDSSSHCKERGIIRPIPPMVEIREQDLQFAFCVDVNYQEAWREGVVFDHCNGMEERSIFFPDLGDEMKIEIKQLRITQDWDEVSKSWKPRGKWVFLELIGEIERESYIPVSIKQIYYDVGKRDDFFDRIKEWTCNVKDSWREPVLEIINEYIDLTVLEILHVLDLPRSILEKAPEQESAEHEPTANVRLESGSSSS